MHHTARIAEWNADKGYGWLQWGSRRLFLHRRDFSGQQRTPSVGEEIRFILDRDAKGRPCASHAIQMRGSGPGEEATLIRGSGLRTHEAPARTHRLRTRAVPKRGHGRGFGTQVMELLFLGGLLVLPALALKHHGADVWNNAAYVLTLSVITHAVYTSDKHRARANAWRIPESNLHLLELLGGWPGAWLAQRSLRHKCSKGSYQFVFWLIILIHQFVAFDSLQNWKLSHELVAQMSK